MMGVYSYLFYGIQGRGRVGMICWMEVGRGDGDDEGGGDSEQW